MLSPNLARGILTEIKKRDEAYRDWLYPNKLSLSLLPVLDDANRRLITPVHVGAGMLRYDTVHTYAPSLHSQILIRQALEQTDTWLFLAESPAVETSVADSHNMSGETSLPAGVRRGEPYETGRQSSGLQARGTAPYFRKTIRAHDSRFHASDRHKVLDPSVSGLT